jgi:hypothetical protein
MSEGVTTLGVLVGLAAGVPAGIAYARAKRAWTDLRVTRTAVSGMRRSAWGLTRSAVGWLLVLGVLGVGAVAWAVETAFPGPAGAACAAASATPSAATPTGGRAAADARGAAAPWATPRAARPATAAAATAAATVAAPSPGPSCPPAR